MFKDDFYNWLGAMLTLLALGFVSWAIVTLASNPLTPTTTTQGNRYDCGDDQQPVFNDEGSQIGCIRLVRE